MYLLNSVVVHNLNLYNLHQIHLLHKHRIHQYHLLYNLALDLNAWNFGIQEYAIFAERTREVFPGCPEVRNGAMWGSDRTGLGIDIDEELATKYPFKEREFGGAWDTVRRADGTMVKP